MGLSTTDGSELAIALATLVRQLSGKADQDALREALVRVCETATQSDVVFAESAGSICANDQAMTANTALIQPLAEAMLRHGVSSITVESLAAPKELLLVANLLSEASTGPDARIDLRAHELGCWHVVFKVHSERTAVLSGEGAHTEGAVRPNVSAALACSTVDDAYAFADGIVEQLQSHAHHGDAVKVAQLLLDLLRAERDCALLGEASDDLRAVWSASFEQLASNATLSLIAKLLQSTEIARDEVLEVLQRAGDAGAGALIARLIAETGRRERRILFDAIVEMQRGTPLLLRSLSHPTWYVVRNAASLLGAMKAVDAVQALGIVLGHPDERVRLAVTTALARIASPAATAALNGALRDRSAAVRHRGFRHLQKLKGNDINACAVGDAMELERNADTQRELLAALVSSTSPEAIPRLVMLCSPSARAAFSGTMRMELLDALTQLRPKAAMPFLRMATEDRDQTVRARAVELINRQVLATA